MSVHADWALFSVVAAPLLVGLGAFVAGKRGARRMSRLGAITAAAGFVVAAVLAVRAAGGAVATAAVGPLELSADPLAVVLLLLVFGVSAIVQTFALRYLAGEPRATWFTGGAGLLTGAAAGMVTAETLIGLAVFWTATGAALCLLLAMYWHLPAARDGVRRTVTAFIIGDLALWAAVGLATAAWGRIDLTIARTGQFGGPLLPLLACLVVVAALSRSAQIPFHRWLPATLAAPTPVSALLHAGVVNAGGILLIRLAPLTADDLARVLTILAGAATMAYGALVMLVKPDVKGALVHSTTAQMGFMILTCGLGLWAAAVIHLVAHGFYKATLFLSSGSAIAHQRRRAAAPPAGELSRSQRIGNIVSAVVLPVAALGAALAVVPSSHSDPAAHQALLVFAWVTGAVAIWGWLRRRPGLAGALGGAAFLLPAAVAYVAVIEAIGGFIVPALPPSTMSAGTVWLIAAAALAVLAVLAVARRAPGADRLQRALYTHALTSGHLTGAHS